MKCWYLQEEVEGKFDSQNQKQKTEPFDNPIG